MKKILLMVIAVTCLSSCFNTRLFVGNVKPKDPVVQVNKQWNSHFLYGLIPAKNSKMNPSMYVDTTANYVVRTHTTFVNGLVSAVTFGIYTPTQTTYYVPLAEIK